MEEKNHSTQSIHGPKDKQNHPNQSIPAPNNNKNHKSTHNTSYDLLAVHCLLIFTSRMSSKKEIKRQYYVLVERTILYYV